MKISVIIPAYNVSNYIEKCIKSILSQPMKDIEIIVVNDGSTDDTLNKLIEIEKQDERVKVFNQENKGIMETRKSGLKEAVGDYLMFVDSDDWIGVTCC